MGKSRSPASLKTSAVAGNNNNNSNSNSSSSDQGRDDMACPETSAAPHTAGRTVEGARSPCPPCPYKFGAALLDAVPVPATMLQGSSTRIAHANAAFRGLVSRYGLDFQDWDLPRPLPPLLLVDRRGGHFAVLAVHETELPCGATVQQWSDPFRHGPGDIFEVLLVDNVGGVVRFSSPAAHAPPSAVGGASDFGKPQTLADVLARPPEPYATWEAALPSLAAAASGPSAPIAERVKSVQAVHDLTRPASPSVGDEHFLVRLVAPPPPDQSSADIAVFLAAFQNMLDPILISDETGVIRICNNATLRLFGYERSELVGANVSCLCDPVVAPHHDEILRRYLETGKAGIIGTAGRELRARRKDGSLIPITLAVAESMIPGFDKRLFVANIHHMPALDERDVLAVKNSRLKRQRAQAKRESELQGEFLANMSHEIRTPLSGVLLAADQLSELVQQSPEYAEPVRLISQCGDVLFSLVNDILDVSKIKASKLEIEVAPMNVGAVLDRVVLLASTVSRANKVTIRVRANHEDDAAAQTCPPDQSYDLHAGQFFGDPQRLQQVLTNLTGNAVKFTGREPLPGGRSPLVELSAEPAPPHLCRSTESLQRDDAGDADDPAYEGLLTSPGIVWLRFAVTDNGPGIAPEKIHTVFGRFGQVDASVQRRFGGTGLGLNISMNLVRLMGGHIWVESVLGQGATFHFVLPFGTDASSAAALLTYVHRPTKPFDTDAGTGDSDPDPEDQDAWASDGEDTYEDRGSSGDIGVAARLGAIDQVAGVSSTRRSSCPFMTSRPSSRRVESSRRRVTSPVVDNNSSAARVDSRTAQTRKDLRASRDDLAAAAGCASPPSSTTARSTAEGSPCPASPPVPCPTGWFESPCESLRSIKSASTCHGEGDVHSPPLSTSTKLSSPGVSAGTGGYFSSTHSWTSVSPSSRSINSRTTPPSERTRTPLQRIDLPLPLLDVPQELRAARRVLIVDDSPSFTALVAGALRPLGFTLEVAPGGREALTAMELRHDVAVVVSDLHMGDFGGLDMAQEILANHGPTGRFSSRPRPSVVILTGSDVGKTRQRALDRHAAVDFVLSKPIRALQLREVVVHFCGEYIRREGEHTHVLGETRTVEI